MPHKYTKEIIFSYTCSKCNNWWSYATEGYAPVMMYCPHCSFKDSTQETPNDNVVKNNTK